MLGVHVDTLREWDTEDKLVPVKTVGNHLTTHDFWNDVSANVVGTPQTLANKTTSAGVADCDDVTFTAVSSGSTVAYLVLYKDTGTPATSQLIACYDTATGLPITTSGADITIRIDSGSSKLFKL